MPKRAVSLTLQEENLFWLRSQTRGGRRRSLSDAVDQIVTAARTGGRVLDASIRSVVNTVDIHPDDPNLDHADAVVAELFAASTGRPRVVRERPWRAYGTSPGTRKQAKRTRG